jgi:hypothetical protein
VFAGAGSLLARNPRAAGASSERCFASHLDTELQHLPVPGWLQDPSAFAFPAPLTGMTGAPDHAGVAVAGV